MIDEVKLANLPRYEPLIAEAPPREAKCVLCDGPLLAYDWRVRLPHKSGVAHVHCAGERGFETR